MSDLKFALRQLLKNPGFTAVAVFTLALGIGANTAMFSFLNSLLLRPLPFPHSEQLVRVFRATPQIANGDISPADYLDLQHEGTQLGRVLSASRSCWPLFFRPCRSTRPSSSLASAWCFCW
jgi:hypothetical protein